MAFEEVLRNDEATTLMHHLPPMDWSEIATKRDLDQFADRIRVELHKGFGGLRPEIGGLRWEFRREFGGLRREIGGLRWEFRREFGGLRRELHWEFGRLRAQVRTQSLNLFFGLLIANAVMVGLLLAIFKYA